MEAARPSFYGLLYAGEAGERHANLAANDALRVYALCAATCARSAQAAGLDYTLVTNRADDVARILGEEGLEGALALRQHRFALDVPPGIAFEAAHRKLELVRAFGTGEFGAFPVLLDLDMVVLRAPQFDADALHAYDLTRQVVAPADAGRVAAECSALAGTQMAQARWFGGEFLAGPADRFRELGAILEEVWPRYRDRAAALFHQGDEMALSAALNRYAASGAPLLEAGARNLVARWWSRRTRNAYPPLDRALECATLHLPADKPYLAARAHDPFEPLAFVAEYREYARQRRTREKWIARMEGLLGRTKHLVPELT